MGRRGRIIPSPMEASTESHDQLRTATPTDPERLCARHGLAPEARRRRLDALGLGVDASTRVERLRDEVLRPGLERILDALEANLAEHDALRAAAAPVSTAGLRDELTAYLLSLGAGLDESSYFEGRLRGALLRTEPDVPAHAYLLVLHAVQQAVIDAIPTDHGDRDALVATALAVTTLDATLVLDAHASRIVDVSKSLETLHGEQTALRKRAYNDTLTGLPNRESITTRLVAAIARSQKTGRPLSIALADLDHFKAVNDTHGHLVGDAALRRVATRMAGALRDTDLLGRWGGEEFVVILEETPIEVARAVAERVRRHVARDPLHLEGHQLTLTLSLGLTPAGANDDADSLLGRADEALYEAKRAGRNQVHEKAP